jgi:monothiol glutaredoxin
MSDVQARIADDVQSNDVLLYMKGTPAFPQCGFSAVTVQILSHIGVKFKAVNVLEDAEVREGIKSFSNWPTIPQLYVKGEFVGGADIVREMFEQQELVPFLEQRGVALEPAAQFPTRRHPSHPKLGRIGLGSGGRYRHPQVAKAFPPARWRGVVNRATSAIAWRGWSVSSGTGSAELALISGRRKAVRQ